METKKLNLANINGKLSRVEMKNIMAGSGATLSGTRWYQYQCYCDFTLYVNGTMGYSCDNPCAASYCGH
jgi:hypothetical protein